MSSYSIQMAKYILSDILITSIRVNRHARRRQKLEDEGRYKTKEPKESTPAFRSAQALGKAVHRYIAAALHTLQVKYKLLIYWNLSATSPGKGPVDGIGGAVNRYVWSSVKARKHVVNNAPSFVETAKDMQGVAVTEMSTSGIESRNNGLKLEELFASAPAIKGNAQFQHLSVKEDNLDTFVLTNDAHDSEADVTQVRTPMETLIKVDDWWAVEYYGKVYPGIVTEIQNKNFEVCAMVRNGSYWK